MSRKYYLLGILLLATLLFKQFGNTEKSPQAEPVLTDDTYKVTAVIDGDTIKIDKAGQEETLRLLGIDTPETDPKYNQIECYGKEATGETRSKLLGQMITVESDASQATRDKFDRLLVYVFKDGQNFNQHLIEEGFAKEYTYAGSYKYQKEFNQAEIEAKKAERGLWSKENCPR